MKCKIIFKFYQLLALCMVIIPNLSIVIKIIQQIIITGISVVIFIFFITEKYKILNYYSSTTYYVVRQNIHI